MQIILNVLEIVAPVFILATIGFFWVKRGYDYPMDFVTNIVMTIGLPCLIFTALMKTKIDAKKVDTRASWSILVFINAVKIKQGKPIIITMLVTKSIG